MKRKTKKSEYEPKKCHCGKVALYRVYFKGYCKEHYADAVKDEAAVRRQQKEFAIARDLRRGKY